MGQRWKTAAVGDKGLQGCPMVTRLQQLTKLVIIETEWRMQDYIYISSARLLEKNFC